MPSNLRCDECEQEKLTCVWEDVGGRRRDDDFLHLGGGSVHVMRGKHTRSHLLFLLQLRCISSSEAAAWRCPLLTRREPGVQKEEETSDLCSRLHVSVSFFFVVGIIVFLLKPSLWKLEDEQHKTGAHTGEIQADWGQPRSGEGAFWQAAGKNMRQVGLCGFMCAVGCALFRPAVASLGDRGSLCVCVLCPQCTA